MTDAERERLQTQSKKIQLKMRALYGDVVNGRMTPDEFAAALSHREITKSELWLFIYRMAVVYRKKIGEK